MENSYNYRVKWYNAIIDKTIKATKANPNKKYGAVSEILADAIVTLEQNINPDFNRSKIDRATEIRIEEFSQQMVDNGLENFLRKGLSKTRSNIVKFFNGIKNLFTGAAESPADFFDNLYQSVAIKSQKMEAVKSKDLEGKKTVGEQETLSEKRIKQQIRQRSLNSRVSPGGQFRSDPIPIPKNGIRGRSRD